MNREQTREFQFEVKLFCGEIGNEVDSTEYYSCHRDIFMDGKGRGLSNLTIWRWVQRLHVGSENIVCLQKFRIL